MRHAEARWGGYRIMLFKCLPEGRPIPGRFPGPAHGRGKWFTIDIHCHLLTEKAEKMVADAGLTMDWQPRHQFANELTRETNREQARRTRVQFTSIEKRLADMDLMGIDIQAITPSPAQTFYSVPADLGIETAKVINDNIADICAKHPDRFVGLGTVPFQAPEPAVAELERLHKYAFSALPAPVDRRRSDGLPRLRPQTSRPRRQVRLGRLQPFAAAPCRQRRRGQLAGG